jgi:hypothetical protein
MEYFGIFCGHLVNFPVIWYILWPFGMLVLKWEMLVYFVAIWSIFWSFGIFSGHLVYFVATWYVVLRKIWQPCRPIGEKSFDLVTLLDVKIYKF